MKNDRWIKWVALIGMLGMGILSMALYRSYEQVKTLKSEMNQIVVGENDNIDFSSDSEDFDTFIYRFSTDSTFQFERIQFPLKVSLDIDFENPALDTLFLRKDWKFNHLFMNDDYTVQTYDNLERKLRDNSIRVLVFRGIENGILVEYVFKRLKGKWLLCEYQDGST